MKRTPVGEISRSIRGRELVLDLPHETDQLVINRGAAAELIRVLQEFLIQTHPEEESDGRR